MKQQHHCLIFVIFSLLLMQAISFSDLYAQDILITFADSEGTATIDSVRIENLTQGKSLTIMGDDVLHLVAGVTAIDPLMSDHNGNIFIYPNPMNDYARIQFFLPDNGETIFTLYDISGRAIIRESEYLSAGRHTYGIYGITMGTYFLSVRSGKHAFSARLISMGTQMTGARIIHENTDEEFEKTRATKGPAEEVTMQYNEGEILKFTAYSGDFITVKTDIPDGSKTITYDFHACSDADGNNYSVVLIGEQLWMAENLLTTLYMNEEPLTDGTSSTTWEYNTTGAYCWYNNDIENKSVYGALYNWYAVVNANGLCPTGWHIPTDAEWASLVDYMGGKDIAAKNLREAGFSTVPAGSRHYNSGYANIDVRAFWWSSTTASPANYAWYRDVYAAYPWISRNSTYKNYGFSVRCLKD